MGTVAAVDNGLKAKLKTTWEKGDYDTFSRYMEADAKAFFDRLSLPAESRLLDVGCGAGQLALIAARRGLSVTGCDIAANWVEKARRRAEAEGLAVRFEEGDAEALPYAAGQFDAVVSLIAAMFAPRPELVASEMLRVCRSGGVIAMGNWTPSGFVGQMFKTIAKHIAPSGMPSPVLWGDEDVVQQRFGTGVVDLRMTRQRYCFAYPFSPAKVVDFFRTHYGPMVSAFASLDAAEQQTLHDELTDLWTRSNQSEDTHATRVEAEYLQVVAARA